MGNRYLLGVDVGTTSIKVAIIDEQARVLGMSSSSYRLITPNQDYAQIDTEDMWRAYLKCIRLLQEGKNIDMSRVAGISISSLCPGLAALGENGEVLTDPIIYSDRRSTEEAEMILEAVGREKLFEITANTAMAGAMSGTSMLWIKRNLPEVYEKTKYFGHVNTLLAQRMSGNFAIDYSNASYTDLFETTGGFQWSEVLCEKIGIDMEKLPPLHASTDVVGGLIHPDLIRMGIPRDTPVIIGGGDTACATLAAGVTKAGQVCESVGTTNVLTICVDQPKFDKGFINRCHVVEGTWIYQGALSHTGASYQWFRDNFCQDLVDRAVGTDKTAFQFMNEEADMAEPGSGGLVFLPYMLGERSPIWDPYARGVFFGISLQTTRKEMNRAVMEGCGYGLRQLSEIAERVTGREIKEFTSIGGGAKSETWAQIKADITGKDIKILDMNDMAPIGAALLAGVGAGIFKDVYEAADKVEKKVYKVIRSSRAHDDIYNKRYQVYIQLYPQIKELYKIGSNLH
ncbi:MULTISPECIES: xylulokinase [Blautia]|uniref:Sugar kinase n=2 Tax=Blautia TaxID=572511 RepID=A0ABR7FHE1_9FIRM|nr:MULTISPECIES: FGGY family carbohydrate kinase [Blautia]MBS5266916.1 sugar kinase [Clostridiales bacterium]MCQ4867772.1 FGGY family carbohydrate kinase [Blautia producta]UOX56877.1 FGGY family carbohydrate kinase [Clostridia bacterium UC5.1-1D4]MBC5674624.1 sugar kinase [Blautia celeris]MCJ7846536.1 FGGY family carbohydrate kinase [Blautia sp. NSJ-175]